MDTIIPSKAAPLPPLIKQSATYKLFVPKKVEEKIRYLCNKFPTLEWSGILFYTHTGNFEDNNLEIHCEDIYPMDLGSATYTKFRNDETIAGYIADNIDLFNCDMGLIHSHNQMSCFFSGTDTATLQSEGDDTNCFVSLIVNNAGTYCAAITRKVQEKKNVFTEYLGSSYEFFGDGPKQLTGGDVGREEEVETTSIEYFMLDVEREIADNPFTFLDKRFEEIENLKKSEIKNQFLSNSREEERDEDFYSWIHSNRNKSAEINEAFYPLPKEQCKEQNLFDDDTMKEMEVPAEDWEPDPDIIHHLVCQMVTCSLIVNKDIDLKQWIVRHMNKKYTEIFGNVAISFDNWKEFIVEFLLDRYDDPEVPAELYNDYDMYIGKIASAMYRQLYNYPENPFIEQYKEVLNRYMYE